MYLCEYIAFHYYTRSENEIWHMMMHRLFKVQSMYGAGTCKHVRSGISLERSHMWARAHLAESTISDDHIPCL